MVIFTSKNCHGSLPAFSDSYLPITEISDRYHNAIRYARLGKRRIKKTISQPTIRDRVQYNQSIADKSAFISR